MNMNKIGSVRFSSFVKITDTSSSIMDKIFEDVLAIYEPQLHEGPGMLWEDQNNVSVLVN